jgi:D-alanyl-D-alanine carboxypeptidase
LPEATKGGHLIQIGALPSSEAAERMLKEAQSTHSGILAGLTPVTETYKSFVRARFAGFANRKAAQDTCEQLRKHEVPCLALEL